MITFRQYDVDEIPLPFRPSVGARMPSGSDWYGDLTQERRTLRDIIRLRPESDYAVNERIQNREKIEECEYELSPKYQSIVREISYGRTLNIDTE